MFWAMAVALAGCVEPEEAPAPDLGPFAHEVVSYEPGDGAGFGQSGMPDVVLGPPQGGGTLRGSLHVVSLGVAGEIVLGFGDWVIEDGPGSDFVVFENAFWRDGDEAAVFAELAEVSVSEDGETWSTFPCVVEPAHLGPWPGCAGWRPVLAWEDWGRWGPEEVGGDPFDLADVGLTRARFVRLRDLTPPDALEAAGPSAGFDLDAVGIVHGAPGGL